MRADSAGRAFIVAVHAHIGPVVRPFGFEPNGSGTHQHRGKDAETSILYEAAPPPFVAAAPHLAEPTGATSLPCVDLWIHLHHASGVVRASLDAIEVGAWMRWLGEAERADLLRDPVAAPEGKVEVLAAFVERLLTDPSSPVEAERGRAANPRVPEYEDSLLVALVRPSRRRGLMSLGRVARVAPSSVSGREDRLPRRHAVPSAG